MTELYQHQKEAIEFFKDRDSIALFFEQGCGKSATALKIAECKFQKGEINQVLIIAPNDVHKQWADEQIPAWVSCKYEVECFGGRGGVKKFYPLNGGDILNIVSVNIDIFSTPGKWKEVVEWANNGKTMIVLDEATCIKNVESQRTQRIITSFNSVIKRGRAVQLSTKLPSSKVRCVLTGTPVTNGPMDLWSIMEFVEPSFFGRNWFSFKQYYGMFTKMAVSTASGTRQINVLLNENTWRSIKLCKDYATAYQILGVTQETYFTIQSQDKYQGPYKHAKELKDRLTRCSIFKKITDCLDMPEKNYIVRKLTMNDEQKRAYASMGSQQITEYKDHVVTALNKLTMATRLQQISSGFIYDKQFTSDIVEDENKDLMPDEVVWLGKTNPKLEALLRDVDESDKPLLILTRYSAEAAKIYELLKDSYSTMLYTGWKKTGEIEAFKEGKYDILVANTACIARGFNLQNSHTILYYSNTFSMELREQSEARIFRAGQKNICKYVDYCFAETIDKTILDALASKKSMLEYFRESEEESI